MENVAREKAGMGPKPLVCIIDDDKTYQFTLQLMFRKLCGINHFITFENGQRAIDFIMAYQDDASSLPDIIILDINMPVMDGWEFMQAYIPLMTELPKSIRLYVVSSSNDEEDERRAISLQGVSGYLVKPLSPGVLERLAPNIETA